MITEALGQDLPCGLEEFQGEGEMGRGTGQVVQGLGDQGEGLDLPQEGGNPWRAVGRGDMT